MFIRIGDKAVLFKDVTGGCIVRTSTGEFFVELELRDGNRRKSFVYATYAEADYHLNSMLGLATPTPYTQFLQNRRDMQHAVGWGGLQGGVTTTSPVGVGVGYDNN